MDFGESRTSKARSIEFDTCRLSKLLDGSQRKPETTSKPTIWRDASALATLVTPHCNAHRLRGSATLITTAPSCLLSTLKLLPAVLQIVLRRRQTAKRQVQNIGKMEGNTHRNYTRIHASKGSQVWQCFAGPLCSMLIEFGLFAQK